ncbi:hypothetical protein ABK040_011001 [Willaertia magna]
MSFLKEGDNIVLNIDYCQILADASHVKTLPNTQTTTAGAAASTFVKSERKVITGQHKAYIVIEPVDFSLNQVKSWIEKNNKRHHSKSDNILRTHKQPHMLSNNTSSIMKDGKGFSSIAEDYIHPLTMSTETTTTSKLDEESKEVVKAMKKIENAQKLYYNWHQEFILGPIIKEDNLPQRESVRLHLILKEYNMLKSDVSFISFINDYMLTFDVNFLFVSNVWNFKSVLGEAEIVINKDNFEEFLGKSKIQNFKLYSVNHLNDNNFIIGLLNCGLEIERELTNENDKLKEKVKDGIVNETNKLVFP